MRVRTNYFKITDMQAEPTKSSTHRSEFMVGSTGIGFLQNRAGRARGPAFELCNCREHG